MAGCVPSRSAVVSEVAFGEPARLKESPTGATVSTIEPSPEGPR
jgi:hypothetical protein